MDGVYKKVQLSRLDIFLSSLKISLIEPIFGLGGASFPIIYELQNNIWRGHPHNLFLELAVSYGYPATILTLCTISILLINSSKLVFKNHTIIKTFYLKKHGGHQFLFLISIGRCSIF